MVSGIHADQLFDGQPVGLVLDSTFAGSCTYGLELLRAQLDPLRLLGRESPSSLDLPSLVKLRSRVLERLGAHVRLGQAQVRHR